MSSKQRESSLAAKSPTGIAGFDEMTGGGLPVGRTTLLLGGPGSGKTIFSLGFLAYGTRRQEPGIFVAFEETAERIRANAGKPGRRWLSGLNYFRPPIWMQGLP